MICEDRTLITAQAAIAVWVRSTFGEVSALDGKERVLRFVEEAVELAQAVELDVAQVHLLVDYVYGRDVGKSWQEIAGCLVTLLAASTALGVDAAAAFETELARIHTPEVIARCRKRQNEKREALGQEPR